MSALQHDAFLYEGTEAFVEHMLPYVREGLDLGEPVLAVTARQNIEALRARLDGEAHRVDWQDSADWYSSPGQAFRRYADCIATHTGAERLRVIGEPVWPVRRSEGIEEWARYESVLNVAFADAPAWIVCPYDTSSLPDAILEHARQTHPMLYGRHGRVAHDGYVEPSTFWATLDDATVLPPPPADARRLVVTSDLAALRAAVTSEAAAAGFPEERLPELVLAVHELSINALTHGGAEPTIHMWLEGDELVCEVADGGSGLAAQFVGYGVPGPEDAEGRGLWLARQLCEFVQLRSDREGTKVRLHAGRVDRPTVRA